MQKLNVLISAHELSPYQGSECAEGWNIVKRLGEYHKITVLYAGGSQNNPNSYENQLLSYFKQNEIFTNVTFVKISQPKITLLISRFNHYITKSNSIGLPFLYYIGYSIWQRRAYKKAKELNSQNTFDIVHHLTAITFREPGYLWKLKIPFVWGPTGIDKKLPIKFYSILTLKSKIFEVIRLILNTFQFNYSFKVNGALKHAKLIYLFSGSDKFKKHTRAILKPLTDAGTYSPSNVKTCRLETKLPITLLWIGRIEDRKAIIILIEALKKLKPLQTKIELTIIGSGCQENLLKFQLKILSDFKISWIKKVNHDEIFEIMKKSDILIHTSIREATTHVIPEALSVGLPIICHKISGMDIAVNETCGMKIPLISPKKSIEGFKKAIELIVNDTNLLKNLKLGAQKRAMEISWDNIVKEIASDYIRIYSSNKTK